MKLTERPYAEKDRHALVSAGIHPLLARLYAARRITSASRAGEYFCPERSTRGAA